MSENAYTFSEDIQRRLVAMLLGDTQGFLKNVDVVKPEFFDSPVLQDFVTLVYQFYAKYKRGIRQDEFLEEVGTLLSKNPRLVDEEYWKAASTILALVEEGQFEYVATRAKDFARFQAIKKAIIDSVDILKRQKDYESILDKVKKALAIGEESSELGTFYYEQTEERIALREAGHTRASYAIHTMIKGVDNILGGGLARRELGVAMGPLKRGKTILSVNFSVGALWDGCNVAHYIMEGGEERLSTMYDSKISGIPKDALKDHSVEVRNATTNFFGNSTNGRLVIKHFPALSCTPLKIENHLSSLLLTKKFRPDMIIVDYLGLMSPSSKMPDDTTRYITFGQITKELLSLAQRGNYAVWLLHQTTKESRKKDTVDLEDSADSIEPLRDADIIITLNQTDEEKQKNPAEMRIFVAGGREVADRKYAVVGIDKERVHIFDLENTEVK